MANLGQLKKAGNPYIPRIAERSFYPDVDSTYTLRDYTGDRVVIPQPAHKLGIKAWSSLPTQAQGMAIHGNLLVRMFNVTKSTTHYIYTISDAGTLTQVASFSCSNSGHSNTLQFAPTVESGNTYPYLYVSDTTGTCIVLSIAADYTVTQVQTITPSRGWQTQIGDDGNIWSITGGGANLHFVRFRKVSVSEGASVTLTSADELEEMSVSDVFDSASYTFQGSKFKYGKAWLPIGTSGSGQKRALLVYDLAGQRTVANIDLTSLGNIEFEDLDFWDGAMILATYSTDTYILRF